MPHWDPSVFHPEANYNREAFPPPQWHIPQGRAQHLTVVPEQMPPAWRSQTHADPCLPGKVTGSGSYELRCI